jgi:hypothetical protein
MSGAVCPSCGVAVVPGYVRCPKCHKPLPQRRAAVVEGGTAVQAPRRFPVVAVVGGVVLAATVIAFFGLRASDAPPPQRTRAVAQPSTARDTTPQPAESVEAPDQPTRPDPQSVANELERALKKQRLWSTVTIVGDHADVQSGSCSDPAMSPMLDSAAPALKAAGLTKLRCLEQSGRVVSDREL